MSAVLLLAVLPVVLVALSALAGREGLDLAKLKDWHIVLAEGAVPSELYAAEEFQRLFHEAGGRRVTIVKVTDHAERNIFIGPGPVMRESRIGFSTDDFGPEDFRIVVTADNVAIAGGRPRGTLYGVYTFLEDYVGVRFLTAHHTHVPKLTSPHVVPPTDRACRPPLAFRWPYYGENSAAPDFAARLRVNTVSDEPRLGGKSPMSLISHTFVRQMPSVEYGREHPEYFALRDGRRLAPFEDDRYETQPCLSNPDVLRIVTESVLKQLEEHPEKGNVSVSQNDNKKHCQCPECRAIDEREGSPMGSLLAFVNAVADRVAEAHPHVMVGTLSYQYSRKPPRNIRPRPNVQIQLCSIECCLMHPINDPDCPKNVAFCRDMAEWGAICKNVHIWNYNTNFHNYLLPCPNLRVIEPNVRYFVEHSARGVFMQAAGNALGAELGDLRNYVIAGLLWDPRRSGQALVDEFLDLHYGPAAPPIRRFIGLVHDSAEARGLHHNCFGRAADYGVDEQVAQAGLDAFEEALNLAGTEEVRRRVEKASVCAVRAALEPVWYAEKPEDVPPQVADAMRPLARRLLALCERHGVTRPWEYGTMDEARQRLTRVLAV
jgi:hypothetical protein